MSLKKTQLKKVKVNDNTNVLFGSVERRSILKATTTFSAIGIAIAAGPFVESMLPSEAAKAGGAPVDVDLSNIESGALLMVEWRGKPVWIVHRNQEMLKFLNMDQQRLSDPDSKLPQQPLYCKNETRSIKPEYLVAIGICTHLGCVPIFRSQVTPNDLGSEWHGGFYCPCHGSKYDLAGRVYKGVPAPTNLVVPPHTYSGDSRLIIGINHA
ncbi:MAG: ubiquinol-cytochrome c reductase iron-sulfur subunit [Methylophilaceae bacterium]|nr:ubiquinol-cytochrome c reductase iron-sulfur subunit [Methylophilaceae bacterium]